MADAEHSAAKHANHRRVSPLTVRILAVNLIAPLMLLAGLLYLDQYERGLLQAELDALQVQADLIGAAVGEGAVAATVGTSNSSHIPTAMPKLEPEQARAMVRRLASLGTVRARLFDPNGLLVADSRRLVGPGGEVQVIDLKPPEPVTVMGIFRRIYDWASSATRFGDPLPQYVERQDQTASDYDEVVQAIEIGVPAAKVRRLDRDRRLLSAAVPVTYYKTMVGALMVSRPDSTIEQSLFEVRLAIIKLFVGILLITVTISFYLARAIVRPVRRLALAAERVRGGQGRRTVIPDLSHRRDEIGDLTVSLRAMTDTLWKRMDATERFAADVAHEIKNPLTSLRSVVETVSRIKDPAHQRRLLPILQDDVARLDRLISDISDASRLDAELSRTEADEFAVRPVLQTLRDVYMPAGEERGVRLHLDIPPHDDLRVRGLEDRVVQIVRNLLGNALSFTSAGGAITLRGRRTDRWIVVAVEDDGPGIPPGKEEAVFERFYTERPEGEKFGSHSGLGLSISRQIAEAHQGTLTAENLVDDDGAVLGARFVLKLPAV